jgi:hypothetical protein
MGELYDCCQRIQDHIDRNGLDMFKARGELALRCGFLITLVKPDEADDPQKISALRGAAQEVFGLII